MTVPLLQKVRLITNWTDPAIAEIVGIAIPTVQAYRCGRLPEKLSREQKDKLLAELRSWFAVVSEAFAEIEMFT